MLTQLSTFVAAQEIIDVFRWVVPYSGPTEFEARVGDTMVFRWAQGMHNVYIHPSMSCDFEGAILVGSDPGTPYTFVEADGSPEGNDMFFACNIGNGSHCLAGQALVVKVFSDPASVSDEPVVAEAPPTDAPLVGEPVVADEAPSTDAPLVDEPVVADEASPTDAPLIDEPVVADEALPTDAPLVDEPAVADVSSATEATEMPVEETKPAAETSSNVDAAQAASGCGAKSVASLVGLTFACLALVLV